MSENLMETFTAQALDAYGTAAAKEFRRRLAEDGRVCGTRCSDCKGTAFPPRSHCPDCGSTAVEWVPIGAGARLYAFTMQSRGLRFTRPDVVGIVEVPDVGLVVTPIGGSFESLEIGQPMVPEIITLDGGIPFYRFVAG